MNVEENLNQKPPLVILAGPTAIGKTALSLRLAKEISGEIISADSVQVYRGMDIGSAKIRPEEMEGVRHHLIDILDPDEEFHVAAFQKLAKKCIREILGRGHVPVLTGGTGFYIQAVLYDIDFDGTDNEGAGSPDNTDAKDSGTGYRRYLEQMARQGMADALYLQLKEKDPGSAEKIHPHNTRRVIRALEFYHDTGQRISEHNIRQREKTSPYRSAYFVLTDEREAIYRRIDRRVLQMMDDGFLEEVIQLKNEGAAADQMSMHALGYRQLLEYLDQEGGSLSDAVAKIQQETRHFAKRQLTWFRREKEVCWIDRRQYADDDAILRYMLDILEKKGIL